MTGFSSRLDIINKSKESKIVSIDHSAYAAVQTEMGWRNAWQENNIFLRVEFEDGTVLISEFQK